MIIVIKRPYGANAKVSDSKLRGFGTTFQSAQKILWHVSELVSIIVFISF